MDFNEPIYNIDEELMRLTTINFNMSIDLEETEFENKMFKLQNNILQNDIKNLEIENEILQSRINTLHKLLQKIYLKNIILNKIIENTFEKNNELLKLIYKNK
jgi:hypothetical protein